MSVLRKIFLFLIVAGFGWLLLLNSFVWIGRQTVMDRKVTKSWLSEGKVYDNFVGELAKLVEKDQAKKTGQVAAESDAKVDVAALTRAAKAAFPPNVLQGNVETILDSSYSWLEGKTDKLVFNLDLAQEKAAFVEALGNEAVTKLSGLPACTNEQISEDFDPFSAGCLPSGTDINAQAEKLKNQISSSQDILPNTSLTADDLRTGTLNGQTERLDEAYSFAPKWYGWLRSSSLILSALILVNGGLIYLLSRPKRRGLKKLAWLFGPIGAVLLLIGGVGLLTGQQLGDRANRFGDGGNGVTENFLGPLVVQVSSSIAKWHLVIGGVYLVIATLCMVVYLVLKKKNPEAETSGLTDKKEPVLEEEPKPVDKEVKKPPLVQ